MTALAQIEAYEPRKVGTMDWESFFRDYRKPDFIPGYAILNKLGGGVFGEVFKAKKSSIGKFYAVKFLKIQDDRLSEQVLKELESVDHFAHVDHPNLVSIEDRGEVCGIPYIVMGYAGDETLKVRLSAGAIETERAFGLFRQILQGVKALHSHSIVHFDLKPANIFLKGDLARVGDYGLSKLMSDSRATLSMGRGTPYYMAPEMLRRKGDARSDVYSLGIILFEMLTGEVPFRGDSEWEILKRHETELVRVPERLGPGIRAFLEQSLDKNPDRRFRSGAAQLVAFEAALAHDPGARGSPEGAPRPSPIGPNVPRRPSPVVGPSPSGLARVREGLDSLLERLPEASARRPLPVPGPLPAPAVVAPKPQRRRGPIGRMFRWFCKVVSFPFLVLRWLLSHLAQVVVVGLVTGGLGYIIHLLLVQALA